MMLRSRIQAATFCLLAVLALGTWPRAGAAGPNGDAKDAYTKGNYADCIRILCEQLRKKPDHQDNIELMETVVPLYVTQLKSSAGAYVAKQDSDGAVASYDQLISVKSTLTGLPPVPKGKKEKVPTTFFQQVPDIAADRQTATERSAAAHYDQAAKDESSGNFRGAAVEFRLASRYNSNYKDAADRYSKNRDKAMVKVCIMPFEDKTGRGYGDLGDVLTSQLISTAMNSNPEFVQLVTRDYVQQIIQEQGAGQSGSIDPNSAAKVGKIAGVHSFVFGKLTTILENYPPQTEQNGTNSTVEKHKGGDRVHQVAYTIHKRQGKVTVQASFQIIEVATGTIKATENVQDVQTDENTWVTFQGDQAAIPYDVNKQNQGERPLQTPAELANNGVHKIADDLAQK